MLGGLPYILAPRGYRVAESPRSQPRTRLSDPAADRGDHWGMWSQSDFLGMGRKDWLGDGPFLDGYGLDLSTEGQISVAKQLAQTQSDTNNAGGYVPLVDGTTRLWMMGKTNGTAYYSADLSTWTSAADQPAASALPTSSGALKGVPYVACSNGALYSLSGTTWTEKTTKPLSTAAYILGSFKGKLWVGYANALYYYDGSAWSTTQFSGTVDGTPIVGAVGNSVLYFVTAGPNARVYMTDGNQLHHVASYPSDFLPKAAVFLETLYLFGHATDDSSTTGQVWRLEESGMVPIFEYQDSSADFGIRSAVLDSDRILWGANRKSGIGVFDPSLDIYDDAQMGFYVGPALDTVTGAIHGIAQFNNTLVCGVESLGIYKEDTPGRFKIRSSRYDADSKNINKLWGFCELKTSELITGQSVTVKTTKDDSTLDEWGIFNTPLLDSTIIQAPSTTIDPDYKNPFLQYELTGDAAGSDLDIMDISFANIELPDNPKRVWSLVIVIEGSYDQPQEMLDETLSDRNARQMLSDLVGLWNKKTTFEDVDGTTYNVIFKLPRASMEDIVKVVADDGTLDDAVITYACNLIEL